MKITHIARRLLQRLEARPPWMRWIEAAPLSVREADCLARRAYFLHQLPLVLLFVSLHAGAEHLGWLASSPSVGLWLLLGGFFALGWPYHIWRLAIAAQRSVGSSTGALALRLRILAIIGFALTGLMVIIFVGLLALVATVTVATNAPSTVDAQPFVPADGPKAATELKRWAS